MQVFKKWHCKGSNTEKHELDLCYVCEYCVIRALVQANNLSAVGAMPPNIISCF